MPAGFSLKEKTIEKYITKCRELGFDYISHYQLKRHNYIKYKCINCGQEGECESSPLVKNSVKCSCQKKIFSKGYIYELVCGPYHYIGKTNTTLRNRYAGHKKSCFNHCKKRLITYNSKIYTTIRKYIREQLGRAPTKEDFINYVYQREVICIETSQEDLDNIEKVLIAKNVADYGDYNINSLICYDFEYADFNNNCY